MLAEYEEQISRRLGITRTDVQLRIPFSFVSIVKAESFLELLKTI